MTPTAVAFALTAAILHASWNALVKKSADALLSILGIVVISGAVSALWLPFATVPSSRQGGLILLSVAMHVGYDVLLTVAYRLSDLSVAYPVARGLAAVLAAVGGVVILGDRLDLSLSVGVGLASLGLLVIVMQRISFRAVSVAAAAAVLLAGFTLVDSALARELESSLDLVAFLFPLHAAALAVFAVAVRGRATVLAFFRHNRAQTLIGGSAGLASYLAVLAALQRGAVGPVLAVRESSVAFAVLIAVVVLRERPSRTTLVGVATLTAAAALIAWAAFR